MAQTYQTPGVYIVEQNAFPNAVVGVATAIPAFIGCTQQAAFSGKLLAHIPTKVESLKQFEEFFGIGCTQPFALALAPAASGASTSREATVGADALLSPSPAPGVISGAFMPVNLTFITGQTATLLPQGPLFHLHNAIRMFYLNGGSICYIVSIGDYTSVPKPGDFTEAIDLLEAEEEPTMLLCPDALMMARADYAQVMTYMLGHCQKTQSRVALFDVYGDGGTGTGATASTPPIAADTERFRDDVGVNSLNYGIAYYPWVNASIVSATDVSFLNLTAASLTALAGIATTPALVKTLLATTSDVLTAATAAKPATLDESNLALHNSLLASSPEYNLTLRAIANYLNVVPVAPAMAGVFTAVDSSRGVWKAPANVSLNAVVAPNVCINDLDQASLNVDAVTGKSINAIRHFPGLGTLVWGARTLDGNSQDWRYINVRRTMIMLEQSIKLAARAYVFEPNDANTWVTVKSMISSFLFNLWTQGALAGSKPDDAYSVAVGLGTTMTAQDILDGYMNVTVLVAISRPAEFIVLTFQQQMQKS